ncbi:MAG: O-acetyl-ADP-ribose deacetylase [Chitinophagaceae bacterium]
MEEKLVLLKGDITILAVDAIVNAANTSLLGGGGVDGSIHRAGGPVILDECRKIVAKQGGCKTGEAVITSGGNLPAKFVIHTVGPVWKNGNDNEAEQLCECYYNCLLLAVENNIRTIAFPNISTGVYGYPKAEAAIAALVTVLDFLQNKTIIDLVYFVCYDEENYSIYKEFIDSKTNTKKAGSLII